MRRSTFFLAMLLLPVLLCAQSAPVIPAPASYVKSNGRFYLDPEVKIHSANLPQKAGEYLVDRLQAIYFIVPELSPKEGKIVFKKMQNTPDFYSINVADDQVTIMYSSEASCFYAVNSLLQLIGYDDEGQTLFLDKCFLQDFPNFSWRGLHLDVSRHFFTVDEVKRYIDLMALYKFNVLHWHLTDDQGWRIEIKKFPKLTEVGAFRDKTMTGHYNDVPRIYDEQRSGGFYTQEEVKEIVQYAKDRFVTVVPEIEMPGHARAALAAYPEYSCTGKFQPVPGEWGIFDDIFCSKPETIAFLQQVLDEIIPLFPSPYIHIGGDEAPKTRWHSCEKCRKVMQDQGLKNEEELQSYFIGQMDRYLALKGKKPVGWDEILEGGLSPNAVVMSWRGEESAVAAVKQQHYVVMAPMTHCYFDYYQSGHPDEPLAIGGYLPLEKVYAFNPVPQGLTASEANYILGGQANVWTEYMSDFSQVEYMVYPRALAMAQVLWCKEKPSYEDFKKVLIAHQLTLLKRQGVNFSQAVFYPEMEISRTESGVKIHFKGSSESDKFNIYQSYEEGKKTVKSDFVQENENALEFNRSGASSEILRHFEVSPFETLEFSHTPFDFHHHSAVGLPVQLITQPSEKFNHRGDLALVDGIKGKRPWKGDEWLGFDTSSIEFIVDLTKVKMVREFRLGFLSANGSWIYLPDEVKISCSENGNKWITCKPSKVTENFSQLIGKKARYIKVEITAREKIPQGLPGAGNVPWTFMDELEIDSE